MTRHSGLGKGLEALIPGSENTNLEHGTFSIPIEKVIPNPHQPRTSLKTDELTELAASIKEHGILQPLLVCKDPGSDSYVLIAGERRLRAASLAGLVSVPVILRQVTDQEKLELALIENVQREDLAPLETAEAYHQLNEDFGLSHEDIGRQVGKSRASITNSLRLLKLPESVKAALMEGKISEGHARALLALPTTQSQTSTLQSILRANLSVRQTEDLVRRLTGEKRPSTPPLTTKQTPEISALEDRLREHLGTKVMVLHGKKSGRLVIHYYSEEELNEIIARILKE